MCSALQDLSASQALQEEVSFSSPYPDNFGASLVRQLFAEVSDKTCTSAVEEVKLRVETSSSLTFGKMQSVGLSSDPRPCLKPGAIAHASS